MFGNQSFYRLMRPIIFLLTIALLSSCTQKQELQGLWIMTSAAEEGEEPHMQSSRLLLECNNEKISFIELANQSSGNLGDKIESEFEYSITRNQLKLEWDDSTEVYDYLLNDSLVLRTQAEGGKKPFLMVFKRVDPMPKLKAIPSGSYLFRWPEDSVHVTFLNDSIILGFNRFGTLSWRLYSHGEANFFIHDYALSPISGIWNTNETDYELRFYLKPERKVALKKLEPIDKSSFYGTWRKHKVSRLEVYDYLNSYPPPPPPPAPSGTPGMNIALTLTRDTLKSVYEHDTISQFVRITEDGSFIYFPDEMNRIQGVWHVEHIDSDSLVLARKNNQIETWYRVE